MTNLDRETATAEELSPTEMQRIVDEHEFWYHTMDLAPGVTTPGWFDLRGVISKMPWPNVKGKRCLDIGTWDWPPDYRDAELQRDIGFSGPPKGAGFRLAKELTGSEVDWRPISIYDLDPVELGTFDVVVCGSLLLHLRDPIRALEAVRSVTSGVFLSSEQIELWLSVLNRGKPRFTLNGSGKDCQWWNFNAAGHRRMLYAAGFAIERTSKPYIVEFNVHPDPPPTPRNLVDRAGQWALTRAERPGILHRAILARPRV
mgnify:CR=1 FL=1